MRLQEGYAMIRRWGGNALTEDWVIETTQGNGWDGRTRVLKDTSPCMTYSNYQGMWITSRGRRMTDREALRIQGLPNRMTGHDTANDTRRLVGNSMSVPTVEAITREIMNSLRFMQLTEGKKATESSKQKSCPEAASGAVDRSDFDSKTTD